MIDNSYRISGAVGGHPGRCGDAGSGLLARTPASGEIQALRQLLEAVELEVILVQADALHANRPFSFTF